MSLSAEESFEAFYNLHWQATVVVTASLCRDMGVAEELVQEAFMRAYRRWTRLATFDKPELWVRRTALNLAVSRFRRVRAESRALTRAGSKRRTVHLEPIGLEVEEFWDAVRSLPPRQAQVVALFYVDDLSVKQIAELLGCAEGTVKAHLHAARGQLRVSLDHLREGS